MRTLSLTILISLIMSATASAGMRQAVDQYATEYGTYQGWTLTDTAAAKGDYQRAYFKLTYLTNPAPKTEECFANVVTVDSCPAVWWVGDLPFYMHVEAKVVRCGLGSYAVSTPLDVNACPSRLLSWRAVSYR